MHNDGDLVTSVVDRLIERFVESKTLSSFAFDVDVGDRGNNVRRVRPAVELATTASLDAEQPPYFAGEFPFSRRALVT